MEGFCFRRVLGFRIQDSGYFYGMGGWGFRVVVLAIFWSLGFRVQALNMALGLRVSFRFKLWVVVFRVCGILGYQYNWV